MKHHEKLKSIKKGVAYLSDAQLTGIIGVQFLEAAIEYARRTAIRQRSGGKVSSSTDAVELLKPYYIGSECEKFSVIYMNRNNTVITVREHSSGGLTGTIADVRLIFKQAIELKACGIILCHNHPSGELKPSAADIELTKKAKEAGKLLEIVVLDHIILGNGFYSFADEGMM